MNNRVMFFLLTKMKYSDIMKMTITKFKVVKEMPNSNMPKFGINRFRFSSRVLANELAVV